MKATQNLYWELGVHLDFKVMFMSPTKIAELSKECVKFLFIGMYFSLNDSFIEI